MDAIRFGRFVAERRKELKMTQKDLAAKIQVTDKAISKWERGLGFPDINSLEPLADALDVSMSELMKSEKQPVVPTMSDPVNEQPTFLHQESAADNVLDLAKQEIKHQQSMIFLILGVTMIFCTIIEILQSIQWNASQLTFQAGIPLTAVIPGIVLILCALVRSIQGKPAKDYLAFGLSLLLIPFVITMGAFLILGVLAG